MPARAIVLAGPSGAGKSHLAARLGLPVLRLDDFYRSGSDPALPLIGAGTDAGLVDWDHPDAWLPQEALAAADALCREGRAEVPIYDLAQDGRCGTRLLDLDGRAHFVAEGIFAHEIVVALRDRDQLAAAYCVTQHRLVIFARRLARDLRERRKPPTLLLRRGVALMRSQHEVVARAAAQGCVVASPEETFRHLLEVAS